MPPFDSSHGPRGVPTPTRPGRTLDVYFYNLREGRSNAQMVREVEAILSTDPDILGVCEAVGYRLPDVSTHTLIRDTSTPSRANIAAYVRKGLPLTRIAWTDLTLTWARTAHPGQHDPRSILGFRVGQTQVLVAHVPPRTRNHDTQAAMVECFDALGRLMAPWTRTGWANWAKVWRHLGRLRPRIVIMDSNSTVSGASPNSADLARTVGGVVEGHDIDCAVVRRVKVAKVTYPQRVAGVHLLSDHKHALRVETVDSKPTPKPPKPVHRGVKYAPADSTTQWFEDNYPGSVITPNVVVLHTTESADWPTYAGGSEAPNYTAKPLIASQRAAWRQHFPDTRSSRALVNAPGGVETNTLNCEQVELIGTCDPAHRIKWGNLVAGRDYLYWPDAPDWALAEVAKFLADAHLRHGVKLVAPRFEAYPASYGAHNGVRFTNAQWTNFYGVCGHQHVPENDHGDPGDIPIAKILTMAQGLAKR